MIHEELIDAEEAPLEPGTEVKTETSHMEGMEGATVEIDSAEKTIVYMVDSTTTTGEEEEVKSLLSEDAAFAAARAGDLDVVAIPAAFSSQSVAGY